MGHEALFGVEVMFVLHNSSRKIRSVSFPGENLLTSVPTSPPGVTFGHTDCSLPPPSSPTPTLPHRIFSTLTLSSPINFSTLPLLKHCSLSVTKALKSSTASSLLVKAQCFSATVKTRSSSPNFVPIHSALSGASCKLDDPFAGDRDVSPISTVFASQISATFGEFSDSRSSGNLCALDH